MPAIQTGINVIMSATHHDKRVANILIESSLIVMNWMVYFSTSTISTGTISVLVIPNHCDTECHNVLEESGQFRASWTPKVAVQFALKQNGSLHSLSTLSGTTVYMGVDLFSILWRLNVNGYVSWNFNIKKITLVIYTVSYICRA